MSLSEATLKKLSKDEVIYLLLDYQNKFETTLTRMNTGLSGLRQDLSDLSFFFGVIHITLDENA